MFLQDLFLQNYTFECLDIVYYEVFIDRVNTEKTYSFCKHALRNVQKLWPKKGILLVANMTP